MGVGVIMRAYTQCLYIQINKEVFCEKDELIQLGGKFMFAWVMYIYLYIYIGA